MIKSNQNNSDVVILIPARYNSSRFPGKPLAPIKGVSMVQRVYQNISLAGFPTYIVTDDQRIESAVKDFGGQVIRVDDEVNTGTDRVFLAYERHFEKDNVPFVINVQGDEPLLQSEDIVNLVKFHKNSPFDVTTLVKEQKGSEHLGSFENPNIVKAIYNETDGQCFYFSRSSIPNPAGISDIESFKWYQHIGVYCFKADALKKFIRESKGDCFYEQSEKLEQLRGLTMGLTFGASQSYSSLVSVDNPEDVAKVEQLLSH